MKKESVSERDIQKNGWKRRDVQSHAKSGVLSSFSLRLSLQLIVLFAQSQHLPNTAQPLC